jgi:hypothetical protein
MRILKMSSDFSSMSVNEMVMQKVWQHHFPEPCGGGGLLWTNWPTEVVAIATLCEFDEYDKFFTTSCDPNMATLSDLLYTFHPKKDIKDGF